MNKELQTYLKEAGLRLVDASFSRAEKRLSAVLQADRFLSHAQREQLEVAFRGMMPESRVTITLHYPNAGEQLERDFACAAALFSEEWQAETPLLRPYLQHAQWKLDGMALTVCVPPEMLQIPQMESYVRAFERRLREMTELPLQLALQAAATSAPVAPEGASAQNEPAQSARPAPPPAAKANPAPKRGKAPVSDQNAKLIYGRMPNPARAARMADVGENAGNITVCGNILTLDIRDRKDKGLIVQMSVTDRTGTLPVKVFLDVNEKKVAAKLTACKKDGGRLLLYGNYNMDTWLRRMCIIARDMAVLPPLLRRDAAENKRVELHLHTKMSSMDALIEPAAAVETAARWGHRAVAITDHGVVQAFPAAVSAADELRKKGTQIKVILGLEGYLLPDCELLGWADKTFVSVALTTLNGLELPAIVEVAAVKYTAAGNIEDTFVRTVDAGLPLPDALFQSAGLTREKLENACVLYDALKALYVFAEDCVPVMDGETAKTLLSYCERLELPWAGTYADSERLSYDLQPVCKPQPEAGCAPALTPAPARAEAGAAQMAAVFAALKARGAALPVMDAHAREHVKGRRSNYHIILLAQNRAGLLNLYRLVSYAHMDHFKKVPQIPRSLLALYREGLIVGSACEAGEVFHAVLDGKDDEALARVAAFYDYLEIQPIANNAFLVREERVKDDAGLRAINLRIADTADRLGKMTIATGDVHFMDPEDGIFRAVLMSARDFKDAEQQAPLYFKTTEEMLAEFAYLGEGRAYAAVVENPNAIADRCESMPPFLSEQSTYAPAFPGADEELRQMAEDRAHAIYGEPLPEVVQKRLDRELNSIIGHGYASLYLMAQRLVQKSNQDGYLVGSRGSVGSSFVATMAGITEVNPLQPHYVCPQCKYSDFAVDRNVYACGVDLPDKVCPACGATLAKLGYEIPFETFLGFKGDKTPDIDLNFSGEYQAKAHAYTETMFGKGHAFRAGTISGLQEKTVYAYVMKYCEQNGLSLGKDEIDRLVAGCSGVKRTTGQHPGGIVIVPEGRDIMEFTPIQYPADKAQAGTITTHFDFHAMDDRLVKLDILGHVDPTALRMLQDITGVDPGGIPLDDPDTMRIFSTQEPLGIDLRELDCDVGSLAIPEFGTGFVRQMLMDTRPTTMEELVRIAGLSHGTDVWLGNAQDLVKSGRATLREVICTRDDIMNYLILMGGDPSMSFKTMESVRKGKGLTAEMERHMQGLPIHDWFADSCKKIGYMFPRAHAAAYVMMAFRVAYYKVHYPLAFYAVYFRCRAAEDFDIAYARGGARQVLKNIRELKKRGSDLEQKTLNLLTVLEVVYEMNLRGIELLDVDVYRSDARLFRIEDGALRPPICAVSGVGENAAEGIAAAAGGGPYLSLEDFQKRTRANSGVVSALRGAGCLDGLPETNQLRLF